MATCYASSNRFSWDVRDPVCRRTPRPAARGPQSVLWAVLVFLATAPTGCEKSEVLGKVSGKVTFQGKPVTEGLVLLANAENGVHVTAELRADGSFDVQTPGDSGLPLGTYQITITPPRVEFPIDVTEPPPIIRTLNNIPAKYSSATTSELTLVVQEGENRLEVDMSP